MTFSFNSFATLLSNIKALPETSHKKFVFFPKHYNFFHKSARVTEFWSHDQT